MAKKDKKSKEAKKARAAEKAKKNESKAAKKDKKKQDEEDEDQDIDEILAQFAKEQEEFEQINIEVVDRPSKRLSPAMVASPLNRREILMFGGEQAEAGTGLLRFYNDLFTYNTESDVWRRITSKNSPMPRSSHAMCAHPSGIVVLFGGEFSSPKQNTFYHYGDTFVLDVESKSWSKVEQKNGPSSRSGHRMACWKNYIMMYGGFRDLGSGNTTYLNDLWLFDVLEYKWTKVEFPPTMSLPDPRSGHSLLPCAEGAIIFGGYTKVKTTRKGVQKGKVLTDCWLLKMNTDPKKIRMERRRKQGPQPSPRVGCSLQFHKNRGIMFGGVYDYEESEENLESEFYNSVYAFNIESNRWFHLSLKSRRRQKVEKKDQAKARDEDLEQILNDILKKANLNDDEEPIGVSSAPVEEEKEETKEYPYLNQLPHPRFNAATCVVDDSLYIFGGMYERGEKEYTMDSMYSIDLGKMDGVKVYWENLKELEEEEEEEDEDEDDEDDEGDDDDHDDEDHALEADEEESEEEEEEPEEEEFPDPRTWLPHPKAFESLRSFYIRTGAQFLEWSISSNRDARGKYLKKAAFDLCEDRFWERREACAAEEDRLEEMGIGEVVETTEDDKAKRKARR
ncbi:hypothetical protein DICA1_F30438 [Diutina catenulata]